MKPILLTAAGNLDNQDRGLIVPLDGRVVVCVADGVGGRSGGTEAANMAVELVRQNADRLANADVCAELLRKIDSEMSNDPIAGETTCALAVVTPKDVFGASVGDSGVWLIPEDAPHINLTSGQQRKPFIGYGGAWPIPFQHAIRQGLLLLATDGLLKYTSPERIVETCRQHEVDVTAKRLIELVRYSSGALPDDVTIILGRM